MARNGRGVERKAAPGFVHAGVKLRSDQMQRIEALCDRDTRFTRSDVIRALVDLALPTAEARPSAMWEPTVPGVKAQSA